MCILLSYRYRYIILNYRCESLAFYRQSSLEARPGMKHTHSTVKAQKCILQYYLRNTCENVKIIYKNDIF
jgi:hypothetical protein